MKTIGIGVIGCGNISDIYLSNIKNMFEDLELIAVADLDPEKAQAQASKYETLVMTTDEVLASNKVDIVLNITTPPSHRLICEKALKAGKHVYVEKPLSLHSDDGEFLINLAKEKGLLIGGAPDTFLGAGIQTCKQLIEDGVIGDIVGANAFMVCHGHESWHPAPEFYYKAGGGPMFDMGPYYITALVELCGQVDYVAGMTGKGFDKRTISSQPLKGREILVDVPTHLVSILRFKSGAIGQLTTSFDVWGSTLPRIEIYGSKGTILVPDPNTFEGPVKLLSEGETDFKDIDLSCDYFENSRGLGISGMAQAILKEDLSLHRANGDLTYHVLKVMEAIHKSSDVKTMVEI